MRMSLTPDAKVLIMLLECLHIQAVGFSDGVDIPVGQIWD